MTTWTSEDGGCVYMYTEEFDEDAVVAALLGLLNEEDE